MAQGLRVTTDMAKAAEQATDLSPSWGRLVFSGSSRLLGVSSSSRGSALCPKCRWSMIKKTKKNNEKKLKKSPQVTKLYNLFAAKARLGVRDLGVFSSSWGSFRLLGVFSSSWGLLEFSVSSRLLGVLFAGVALLGPKSGILVFSIFILKSLDCTLLEVNPLVETKDGRNTKKNNKKTTK